MKNKTILAVGAIGTLSVISLIAMQGPWNNSYEKQRKVGPGFERTEEVTEKRDRYGNKTKQKTVTTKESEKAKQEAIERKNQEKARMKQERENRRNNRHACPCNRPPKSSTADVVACGCNKPPKSALVS